MKRDNVSKNYIFSMAYQILTLITPLITTPYVSRVLNASLIGDYNFTNSINQYFILFAALGVALYAQREIAYAGDDRKRRSIIFWEIQVFKTVTFSISGCLYWIVLCNSGENVLLYKVQLIYIIAALLDISWLFQGLELFKITVLRNIIVKVISIISIFLFVKSDRDLVLYVLILCGSQLISNLTIWAYVPRFIEKVQIKSIHPLRHLKPTLALFIPQLASQVYLVFDKTVLGILSTNEEVGYYTQAEKIVKMSVTVLTALGTVLMPRIAAEFEGGDTFKIREGFEKAIRISMAIGIPMCIGIIGVAKSFVPWFLGPGYDSAADVMIVLAPLAIFMGISGITGPAFLIPMKLQKEYTISVLAGAGMNLVLNFLFIPIWGAVGASIGTIVSEGTVMIIQALAVLKRVDGVSIVKIVLHYALLSIPMAAYLVVINSFQIMNGALIIPLCVIAIFIYAATLFCAKDKIVKMISNKFRHTDERQ